MSATLTESRKDATSANADTAAFTSRLAAAGRILQEERGATCFLRACPWILGSIAAAFVADVIFHFGANARITLDLLFLGLLAALISLTVWIAKGSRALLGTYGACPRRPRCESGIKAD
jgi:hypothetical protein